MNDPRIILRRPGSIFDWLRDYIVVIDGKEVGRIRSGETIILDVAQDEYEIHMKIDWSRSNSITLQNGVAEKHLVCYNTFSGRKALIPLYIPFVPLYYISFGRRNYLTLKEVEPIKSDNNVKLPCFRNWSLKKLLIWASVVAYLSGLIISIITWLSYRQIDNTYKWNWEILYGPLITVLGYWMLGGMVVLYLRARGRGKLKKNENG